MNSSQLQPPHRFILLSMFPSLDQTGWCMLLMLMVVRVTAPDDVDVDELKNVEVPGLAVDILDFKM